MSNRLVVHAHMDPRRTGVTRHVESVMPGLLEAVEVAWVGRSIDAELPRMSWSLLRRRARLGPVVLHVHRNRELIAGLLLRALGAKLRIVYTRHFAGRPGLLTRLLMRRADTVISLTEAMAGSLPVKSVVVHHGVDTRRFSPPQDRGAAWAGLGLGGELGIGVVGPTRPDEGEGDFVEAVSPLLAEYPEWRAVLVGAGRGSEGRSSSLSIEAGPSFHRLGEREDMESVYRGLSIVVQPSHSEDFGLALLEAMASGCCVVSSDSKAAREIIRDGETGFLFEPGDKAGQRVILEKLMADPGLADGVGRRGAREVATRFSVIREIGALARIYGELLPEDAQGSGSDDP